MSGEAAQTLAEVVLELAHPFGGGLHAQAGP